jgi:hypothetical protein
MNEIELVKAMAKRKEENEMKRSVESLPYAERMELMYVKDKEQPNAS